MTAVMKATANFAVQSRPLTFAVYPEAEHRDEHDQGRRQIGLENEIENLAKKKVDAD